MLLLFIPFFLASEAYQSHSDAFLRSYLDQQKVAMEQFFS